MQQTLRLLHLTAAVAAALCGDYLLCHLNCGFAVLLRSGEVQP